MTEEQKPDLAICIMCAGEEEYEQLDADPRAEFLLSCPACRPATKEAMN
jgi:hypothetical protein